MLDGLCERLAPSYHQTVLIFGLGLIGRSILSTLRDRDSYSVCKLPFSWAGEEPQEIDGQRILDYVSALRRPSPRSESVIESRRFDIVWSAGSGGFGSMEEQIVPELRSYEYVLGIASRLLELFPNAMHSFHLLSSAGGLFEGQCNVGPETQPRPRRPYGFLKLNQEQLLCGLDTGIRTFVYRPSSVYGFVTEGARFGLVTTLISNGIMRKVTRVFGDMYTLRDYLLASDVGGFVGERVSDPMREPGVFTLASGKPSTISEILRMTEALLDRNVYVACQPSAANSAHNTFRPVALPRHWVPTDLSTGMRLTKLRLFGFFVQRKNWSGE